MAFARGFKARCENMAATIPAGAGEATVRRAIGERAGGLRQCAADRALG